MADVHSESPLRDSRAALTSSSSGAAPALSASGTDVNRQKPIFLLELIKFGDNEAEIKWIVKNFSRLEDEEVESEPFVLGGIKWRIIMFPKGNFKKEKKKALYFALYLGIDDFEQLDRRLDVKLTLSVVNQKYSNKCSDVFSPGDEDSDWGFTQFMKLGELQNNAKGWIVDDCIWVEADIKLLNVDTAPELKSMWTKMMPLEELLSDMRRLRTVGAFHDVYFVVEKKRIPAHKAIVNARCAELGKLIEDKPEVDIKGIRQGVLEQILDYVYFDTIEFDADRILEVAAKAQEFKLFRLGCICENLINQNLSVDNVLVLLMSSEEQHSQSVKHLCLLFIRDHYVDVVSKSGFLQSISKKHPQLMVEIAQAPTLLILEDGEQRSKPPSVSPSTISTDLGLMLQSKTFADITFVVDNETIRAHKAIISNRCEFFSRMFQGGMLEHSSSQISLDLSAPAFKLVLRYLYTNSVSLSVSSLDDVFNLLDLSERFLLKRLKNVCESILKKVLDIDNVVEILKYCGIYDLPDLKQTCLQMISKYRVLLCTKEHLSPLEQPILVDLAVLLAKPDMQPQPGSS